MPTAQKYYPSKQIKQLRTQARVVIFSVLCRTICSISRWGSQCGNTMRRIAWNYSQNLLRSQNHTTFWVGGFKRSTHVGGWLPFLLPLVSDADSLHKSADFCAFAILVMSRGYGEGGYAWCLGLIIKPLIDLHIPRPLFALPASRAGLPERMSSIPGILCEPLLPSTNPKNLRI